MNPFFIYAKRNGYIAALFLSCLYVLPIVLCNIFYIDDISRSVAGYARWSDNGRPLAEWIIKSMSFGGKVIDISPLPLILSVFTITGSSYFYCYRTNVDGKLRAILISLSLLVSPFFLQNLSYKFDVFTMSLSVASAVIAAAVMFDKVKVSGVIISTVLLISTLSLYQSSINIFISLTCLNFIARSKSITIRSGIINILASMSVLVLSLIIYKLLIADIYVSGSYSTNHAQSSFNVIELLSVIERNASIYLSMMKSALSGVFGAIFLLTLIISLSIPIIHSIINRNLASLAISLLSVVGILLSAIGVLLILNEPVIYPRVLTGFSGLLFCVIYILCANASRWSLYVSIPFVASCFLISYMYGNALQAQKTKEDFLFSSMAREIISHDNIKKIRINGNSTLAQSALNANEKSGIIKLLTPSYIRSDWMFGAFLLNRMGLKVDFDSAIDLKATLKRKCSSTYSKNALFATVVENETMIFDFNICR